MDNPPGVYIEETNKFPPSINAVQTAIPAFIGYTEKAEKNALPLPVSMVNVESTQIPVSEPVHIASLKEYELYFGTAPKVKLDIHVEDIFNIPVTPSDSTVQPVFLERKITVNGPEHYPHTLYYHMQMYFANGGGPCYVVSVGSTSADEVSKAGFLAGVEVIKHYNEPTLLVFPQGIQLATSKDLYQVYDAALAQAAELKDRFVVVDCYENDHTTLRGLNGIGNLNLKYGAAYHPYLQTSLVYLYDDAEQIIFHNQLPVTPGTERMPGEFDNQALSELTEPIKALIKAEITNQAVIVLPPCSTMVGVYASVDRKYGVWKAPVNVSLDGVIAPTVMISHAQQGEYNVDVNAGKSINIIRYFTGKGTLVWGARTLAGNDSEWRYISVRRFFNMVEESTKHATEQFVFEPNDANTWVKVQAMIENFLNTLWRQGALQGVKPEHAFYVAVGLGKTMTATDMLEGIMITEIGMAMVRPAEFIILRFSHKMAES